MKIVLEVVLLQPGDCKVFELADGRQIAVMAAKQSGLVLGESYEHEQHDDDTSADVTLKPPTTGSGGVLTVTGNDGGPDEEPESLIAALAKSDLVYAHFDPEELGIAHTGIVLNSPQLVELVQGQHSRAVKLAIDTTSLDW